MDDEICFGALDVWNKPEDFVAKVVNQSLIADFFEP
jgi:hypothetical protein